MNGEAQVRIDLSSPEPAYRQIAGQVRALIVEGALAPGATLPAVRRLAIDLGVHFNTVAEAYRQLAEEGHIDVSHGRVARVVARQAPPAEPEKVAQYQARLRNLLAEARSAGLSREQFRELFEGDEP